MTLTPEQTERLQQFRHMCPSRPRDLSRPVQFAGEDREMFAAVLSLEGTLRRIEAICRRHSGDGRTVATACFPARILAIIDGADLAATEPERLPTTRLVQADARTQGPPLVVPGPSIPDRLNSEPDHLPASGPDLLAGD